MKNLLIDADNRVVNVIILEIGHNYQPGEGITLMVSETGTIGDTYDSINQTFTSPPPPPAPPEPDPEPARVTKADFQRLLTPGERYALNDLRVEIGQQTLVERRSNTFPLLRAAEDVMFAFEQPAEFIELDHADTAQGLALLSYLDILTGPRISQVIANQPPV